MARETWRLIQLSLGWVFILVLAPVGWLIPGPFGFAAVLIGLVLILRSSQWARRQFIKLAQRHPKMLGRVRRALGRNGRPKPAKPDVS